MRLSLRVKWTGVVLFIGVVPLLVVAILVGQIQRAGLFRAEQELENAVVDEASRSLSRTLLDGEEAVHRAAVVLADARIEEEARLGLARDAVNATELVATASIFAADGALIGSIDKRTASAAVRALPASFTREPRPRWIWARDQSSVASLQFVEPVLVDGVVTAWVLGTMRPELLTSLVVDLSRSRFGRADRLVLIDQELRVVAGDPATWPGGSPLAGTALIATTRLEAASFETAAHVKTATYSRASGEPMVGTVRVMPSMRWAIAVERPELEAFEALTTARRAFWIAALTLALIALVLGTILARRTTRPIEELVGLTRAYGKREFGRRSKVTSGDELEELGESLGKMADDLAQGEVEIKRRAAVEAGLARYLPAEVASAIASGTSSLALGGRRVPISVIFADAAAFTTFAEKAPPERVVALLNELFTVLSEVVFRHGGMVDKFMGDCIMAVFGVHDSSKDHVASALAAAEDMHRFVEASAPRWKRDYDYDVHLGIGLATGEALVGNLGSEKRMEFTAVGDAVNVASRLETLARPGQTLVTASVASGAAGAFDFRSLGVHPLRGRAEPVEVLEVLG